MGCFIFFRFAYIFTTADLDSIKFSCSVLEDFSAVVLTDLSREKLKQEVLSDVDDFRVDSRNSVSDKEDDEESARSWNPKFDSNGGGEDQSLSPPLPLQVVSKSSTRSGNML
ncbi:uncharacterized protein LOC116026192 [Ipomoea triloba]|uniref:uncharacterized protein LOC116026192 n=1 Tax=Ipomoea triloba TaxID=35885 RepID=UPI00125DD31E|nr:uncharacterized protein LOC116026192 [Ipomoea triloba]